MKKFYMYDKSKYSFVVNYPKACSIFFGTVSLILLIIDFLGVDYAIVCSGLSLFIAAIFLVVYIWCLKTWRRKIAFTADKIQILNYKDKLIYDIEKTSVTKIAYKTGVAFFKDKSHTEPYSKIDFIVLYIGAGHEDELDYEFEYRDYRNDRNFILIPRTEEAEMTVKEYFEIETII